MHPDQVKRGGLGPDKHAIFFAGRSRHMAILPACHWMKGKRVHDIAIGCAGWSIPREYRELFGTGDSVLARYASLFSVAEINSSFYRSHQHATYARWAASVPAGFRFSVKIPKTISHEMGLRG